MVSNDTNLEGNHLIVSNIYGLVDELTFAYDEIKKNEKELKSLSQVSEFLFETIQDLNVKVESEQQTIEDYKREIYGFKQKHEAIMVRDGIDMMLG